VVVRGSSVEVDVSGVVDLVDEIGVIIAISSICHFILLKIFSSVIGNMSKHIRKLGLPPIKTPKIYARCLSKEREAFVTENLRKQGFVMHDRKKGQDLNHAILVLEELGRIHASSLLLEDTIAPKTFVETFDHFQETWLDIKDPAFIALETVIKTQVECTIKYLSEIPKYEKCVQWLKANIDSVGHYYLDGNTPKEPFDVLELERELEKKKIYGLICGIMIVVGALFVEGEDEMYNLEGFSDDKLDEFADEQVKHFQKIAEREGSFKDRFLSLFDDMLVSPVFKIQ
ncbi:hypothetical protein Avbf_12093, partial [Armadillidium vulgare]